MGTGGVAGRWRERPAEAGGCGFICTGRGGRRRSVVAISMLGWGENAKGSVAECAPRWLAALALSRSSDCPKEEGTGGADYCLSCWAVIGAAKWQAMLGVDREKMSCPRGEKKKRGPKEGWGRGPWAERGWWCLWWASGWFKRRKGRDQKRSAPSQASAPGKVGGGGSHVACAARPCGLQALVR